MLITFVIMSQLMMKYILVSEESISLIHLGTRHWMHHTSQLMKIKGIKESSRGQDVMTHLIPYLLCYGALANDLHP